MHGDVDTGDGNELLKLKAASGTWTTGYNGAETHYSWKCSVFCLRLWDRASKE